MSDPRKAGLDELDCAGRRVLLRVDFNVPLADGARIRDDARIRAALPTITELLAKGARVVTATHLGRPGGEVVEELSTRPLAQRLAELLGHPVGWVSDCVGPVAEAAVQALGPGEILLLENLRFHAGEEANDFAFARDLARLGDVYVDDAFGTAHRAHASTAGVAHLLPAYAGRLMEQELFHLGQILEQPARPLLAVIGGSKLSTKLGIINHLLPRIDGLCLGGAMAATFLMAQGVKVGASLVEEGFLPRAADILARARQGGLEISLPTDVVVAPSLEASADQVRSCPVGEIGTDMILDIGPLTVSSWAALVARAGTVVWNGPLGAYERPAFAAATRALARAIAASSAVSVTGGGDLQSAIETMHLSAGFTHVSTGGGATLEFLEGRDLPGVAVLRNASTATPGPN